MSHPRRAGLRRVLKIVGLSLASLVGLFVVSVIAFTVLGSISHTDTFSLADAEPVHPRQLDALPVGPAQLDFDREPSVYGVHRLQRGRGLVLALRAFSPGDAWAIDDETYEKLTVWLPEGLAAASRDFDLTKDPIVVTLSTGGSAWTLHDCSGYVDSGQLRVAKRSGAYAVSLRGNVTPRGSPEHCRARPVEYEFEAKPIGFEALTPWLGGPATEHGLETFR